jgi:serine/threonine protein kinase
MLTEEKVAGREYAPPPGMADSVARLRLAVDDPRARSLARVGSTLSGKWTLERLLGLGGMGAVYAGRHRNGARGAVKVLHTHLAREAGARNRFLREGYAANRVDHAGVVKVLDDDLVVGGPDHGTEYLVMELLVGESLEAMRRRGLAFTEWDVLVVVDLVLEVLEVAHARGVLHRDIKPDNIFITRTGAGRDRIKVLDFGLARLLEGRSSTVHGLAIGTPPYMSPEQAAGQNAEIDGRTDLFALAASGFRLITGRRIHEGSSSVEVLSKMGKLRAPKVRDVAPRVSEALACILDRALEFRREDRYESASVMRADVQRALAASELGAPRLRETAEHDESIELSAADFSAIQSVELSAIEDLASRAGDVSRSRGIELSESELETKGLGQPPHVERRVAPTQPMLATDPVLARPPEPAPVRQAVSVSRSVSPSPASRTIERARRSTRARVIVAVALAGLGAILFATVGPTPGTVGTAEGARVASPGVTTRLAPPPPQRTGKPGKRTH